MITRKPFSTEAVPEIDSHLQERLREVEANFENEAYPRDKPRKITLEIIFEPDRHDPDEITAKVFSACKLPKRYGKKVNAVMKNGKIMVEEGPEDMPLFPSNKVTNLNPASNKGE